MMKLAVALLIFLNGAHAFVSPIPNGATTTTTRLHAKEEEEAS